MWAMTHEAQPVWYAPDIPQMAVATLGEVVQYKRLAL